MEMTPAKELSGVADRPIHRSVPQPSEKLIVGGACNVACLDFHRYRAQQILHGPAVRRRFIVRSFSVAVLQKSGDGEIADSVGALLT